VNLGGAAGSSALGEKEKSKAVAQGDHRGEWMSTPGLVHFTAGSRSQAAAWLGAWRRVQRRRLPALRPQWTSS